MSNNQKSNGNNTGKTLADYQAEESARNKMKNMQDSDSAEPKSTAKVPVQTDTSKNDEAISKEQLVAAHSSESVPAPEPVDLNLLAKQKKFTFTDANGHDWNYTLQFPGIRKVYDMLDESRMPNGIVANTLLWEQYLKEVIVEPHNLKLDVFDHRPGLAELMDAADTFLGEAQG